MLKFSCHITESDPDKSKVFIVGRKNILAHLKYEDIRIKFGNKVPEEVYKIALQKVTKTTEMIPLYLKNVIISSLPNDYTRHNTPAQTQPLSRTIKNAQLGDQDYIVMVCEYKNVLASACAIARTFPYFTRKKGFGSCLGTVHVELCVTSVEGQRLTLNEWELQCLESAAEGVQLAARIVDTPCSEMNTKDFLKEITQVGEKLGIEPKVISGEELEKQGFGGMYNVGKAATHGPIFATLSHTPPGATKNIAWVGKGVVYDTGGLSIKNKLSMIGMKRDCGGAAAILGAFYCTIKMGFQENLHAIFCLAENAVGPNAIRPDDIITMYSGKTVEITNTDAEGRLVVADGVSYAEKDLNASIILEMSTLTGMQGSATGKYHAAIMTNSDLWERLSLEAGRISGDLLHPVPFTPELHFTEFYSVVADMKNSVSDYSNAAVSCAGLFIMSHLGFDFSGDFIHIDMSKTSHFADRATGYGVALLLSLFGEFSKNSLLQRASPRNILAQGDNCTEK